MYMCVYVGCNDFIHVQNPKTNTHIASKPRHVRQIYPNIIMIIPIWREGVENAHSGLERHGRSTYDVAWANMMCPDMNTDSPAISGRGAQA